MLPSVKIVKVPKQEEQYLRVQLAAEELTVPLHEKAQPLVRNSEKLRSTFDEGCSSFRLAVQSETTLPLIPFRGSTLAIPKLAKPTLPKSPLVQSLLNVAWECYSARHAAITKTFMSSIDTKVENCKRLLEYRNNLRDASQALCNKLKALNIAALEKTFKEQWQKELQFVEKQANRSVGKVSEIQVVVQNLQNEYLEEQDAPECSTHTETFLAVLVDGHAERSRLLRTIHKQLQHRESLVLRGKLENLAEVDTQIAKLTKHLEQFQYSDVTVAQQVATEKQETQKQEEGPAKKRVTWNLELDSEEDEPDLALDLQEHEKGKHLAMLNVMLLDLDIRLKAADAWADAWMDHARIKRRSLVAKAITMLQDEEESTFFAQTQALSKALAEIDERYKLAESECMKFASESSNESVKHDMRQLLQSMKFAYEVGLETARDSIYAIGITKLKAISN